MQSPSLRRSLKKALFPSPQVRKLPPSSRVVVLGVGSDLRSDDAAGIRVAERVALMSLPGVRAVIGGTAPENATGEIRRIDPTHVLIVDAADLREVPGAVRLIEAEEVGGISFCTHTLPLSVLSTYLTKETACRVFILGIQPKSLAFGGGLSGEVEAAVEEALRALKDVLGT